MKYFITTSKSRQVKRIHAGPNCPLLSGAGGVIEVDPATLRVVIKCKYCFG